MTNKLKHVIPYLSAKENKWFLALQYEYGDNNGLHQVEFPKVELNIPQSAIPELIYPSAFSGKLPYLLTYDYPHVYEGEATHHKTGEIFNHVYMTDILVEPKIHKMTLEDIEAQLGYKIEIIDRKD